MDYVWPNLLEVDVVAEDKMKEGKKDTRVEGKKTSTYEPVEPRRKAITRVVMPPAIPRK